MRYINKEKIESGMILASTIFDKEGNRLLNCNVTLRPDYIRRLLHLDIPGIYIYDELSKDIHIEEVITSKTISFVFHTMRKKDYDSCVFVATAMVNDLVANIDNLPNMSSLLAYDGGTFQHSMNVAVLAIQLGIELEMSEENLKLVATAGLLHDIGKQEIDSTIINKPGALSAEEKKIMEEHPIRGYLLVKDSYSISSLVKHAILCHHENWDGSGYPDGRTAKDLRDIDLMVHLCDVYEALTAQRSYKNAINPADAMEFILSQSGIMFNPEHVQAFRNCIFPYATGTEVILSTGQHAVVKKNYKGFPARPEVITLDTQTLIDLRKKLDITITDIFF